MRWHPLTIVLAALALGCGSSAAGGPEVRAFAATVEWTPSMRLDLTIASAADLVAVQYAWVRPDGTVIGREALLLGAALGDDLHGQRTVTATRRVGTSGFLPPVRMRLRALDVAGHSTQAYAEVLHPAFGAAGDVCDGAALACAGELACQAGLCTAPATGQAACGAAAAPAWTSGVTELAVPTGGANALSGTCWPLDAAGTSAYQLVLDAPAGEHLDLVIPPGAAAMLRTGCAAPSSEIVCFTQGGGLDLEAGSYTLAVTGSGSVAPGAVIRATRTPL